MPEKDPFGDKLKDKERGEEEQYFAKRERALLDKLRGGNDHGREAPSREDHGRCPKCGGPLSTTPLDAAAAETCSKCLGADPEEKEALAVSRRRGERWLARFLLHSLPGTG
jgi:hypothetical protein